MKIRTLFKASALVLLLGFFTYLPTEAQARDYYLGAGWSDRGDRGYREHRHYRHYRDRGYARPYYRGYDRPYRRYYDRPHYRRDWR